MREILFRGKRIDNGEWVEGYLIEKWSGKDKPRKFAIDPCNTFDETGWYSYETHVRLVVSSTVGQFTGLTDKTDKKIFEGDVVVRTCTVSDEVDTGVVRFDTLFIGFRFGENYSFLNTSPFVYEVIGNIHDNPELTEDTK